MAAFVILLATNSEYHRDHSVSSSPAASVDVVQSLEGVLMAKVRNPALDYPLYPNCAQVRFYVF